jgi:hypothetical protein
MTVMPGKKSAPRIKNEVQYEALRDKGYSKTKSARIANTPDAGEKGGKAKSMKTGPKKTSTTNPKKSASKEEAK